MLNFAIGPVQAGENIREIGREQIPYFRTAEFSSLMLENDRLARKFAKAGDGCRTVFLTSSGSGAMEAAIMNTLSKKDKAIVVNGGSFGARFVDLLGLHGIPFSEIKLKPGEALRQEHLDAFDGKDCYTCFLVNKLETSTGTHYDMNLISSFCQKNSLFLIADCISTFLADPFDMEALGVDVMIAGSQKALACPPGIAFLCLSPRALARVETSDCPCRYFDLKLALDNMDRGQTPWTPAVGILTQINARLREIDEAGGAGAEISRVAALADYFRGEVARRKLPFIPVTDSLSNAVTPLHPTGASANDIFLTLKDEYGIWICPNGGELKDSVFRVGHLGALSTADFDILLDAFSDMLERGLI